MKKIIAVFLLIVLSGCVSIAEEKANVTVLPDLKSEYVLGDYDENLIVVKERLHSLGYYSDAYIKDRILTGYYNITLYSRVRLLQIFNDLPVTGFLDKETIDLLFSEQALSEKEFFSQDSSIIPSHLMVVTSEAANYSSFKDGIAIKAKVKNHFVDKSIVAYEASFIAYDVWNKEMDNYLTSNILTSSSTIKPASEQYSASCGFFNQEEMFDVFVGITRFRLDDGTIINVPEDQIVYHSWRAPFNPQ